MVPITIGEEMVKSHIQTNHPVVEFVFLYPLHVKAELHVIAIATTYNPNPFYLVYLVEMEVTSSPEIESSCLKTVCESDVPSVL